MKLFLILFLILSTLSCDSDKDKKEDLCLGIKCSNNGECFVKEAKAFCNCNEGYHLQELECIKDTLQCKVTEHEENKECVQNIKFVDCLTPELPENAIKIDSKVKITWNDGNWSKSSNCEWDCNKNYTKKENLCVKEYIYGVTIDNIENLDKIITSLKDLPKKMTARIVFDKIAAKEYSDAINKIGNISYIMGQIFDSEYIKDYSFENYKKRVNEYYDKYSEKIDIWEIGNEVNGEWTGEPSIVAKKTNYAYKEAKKRGFKTALTLYYNDFIENDGCYSYEYEKMRNWAKTRFDDNLKNGIDYVFISYYEEDCDNHIPSIKEWNSVFTELGEMFPNAKLGFGEVGTSKESEKERYLKRYYSMDIKHPRYVGGHFWWYFKQDMVPKTKLLWSIFNNLLLDNNSSLNINTTWQWQLVGEINSSYNVDLYDIDLFDTPKATINLLKNDGKQVVCYFSAGSYEEWRADHLKFLDELLGKKLDDWDGEKWLDISNPKLKQIMIDRLDLAKEKGCDGVEPDNVDGYRNNSGFPLTENQQLSYNKFLALEAHKRGLKIGLKNDVDQIVELEPFFDFTVNEQCHEFDECETLKPFTDSNKPIFNAEYKEKYINSSTEREKICNKSKELKIQTLILPLDLNDSFRYSCK